MDKFGLKKRIFLVPLFIMVVLASFFVFYEVKENSRNKLSKDLSNAITQNKLGRTEYIEFSSITTFRWDRVYFFQPYTTLERIKRILGINSIGAISNQIQSSDNITLIVFTKNKRVIQYLEYYRNNGDFAYLDNEFGYSINEAKYFIDQDGKMNCFDCGGK